MGAQRASAQGPSADIPDGFGVAVVREEGQWRCSAMAPKSLTSLAAAETELRELRSAGAVFGLLDVDDEFFVIVRPAPSGTRLLLSDATAALDYDIAAEVLDAEVVSFRQTCKTDLAQSVTAAPRGSSRASRVPDWPRAVANAAATRSGSQAGSPHSTGRCR